MEVNLFAEFRDRLHEIEIDMLTIGKLKTLMHFLEQIFFVCSFFFVWMNKNMIYIPHLDNLYSFQNA